MVRNDKWLLNQQLVTLTYMRVTPPFWYTVFRGGGLDGTQYAKGRYAVRKYPVISYADIDFYFKQVQFSSRNTTNVTYKVK